MHYSGIYVSVGIYLNTTGACCASRTSDGISDNLILIDYDLAALFFISVLDDTVYLFLLYYVFGLRGAVATSDF